jgi:phosphatidylinositol-3-phosphatase
MEELPDPYQAERLEAGREQRKGLRRARLLTIVGVAAMIVAAAGATAAVADSLPPIRHVFVIVLENESASVTFGPTNPAPYLSKTLVSEGAFLPNYYATGHASNDNYISMISGQAPNTQNQDDCILFDNFTTTAIGDFGQQEGSGCVYPAGIQNIATQLDAAGDSWRDYNQDMGNDLAREATECGHPAIGSVDHTQTETTGDAYATRHDPFVYFHSIIDNTSSCDTHVVNLSDLPADLSSAATTPNYVFITPDLCGDGHDSDSTCASNDNGPGGFDGINQFLTTYVPMITNSPAFKEQNGLLLVTFDEAATSDASSCCNEIPGPGSAKPGEGGAGGGRVGAVLLSPCIKPGTVSNDAYNHYTMLGSVENIFGLPHLGYAGLPGETYFGSDIFTGQCNSPPSASLGAPPLLSTASAGLKLSLRWGSSADGATYEVQLRRTSGGTSAWRTLVSAGSASTSTSYATASGQTYQVRVRATNGIGLTSLWKTGTVVVPTAARPSGVRLRGKWSPLKVRGSWEGHALTGSGVGSTYTYSYDGGSLALIAGRSPSGGRATISFNGHSRTVSLRATRRLDRQVVFRGSAKPGHHTLRITVDSGSVSVEGLAITNLG